MLRANRGQTFSSSTVPWLEPLEARNVLTIGLSFLAPPVLSALEAVNPTGSEIAELPVISDVSESVADSRHSSVVSLVEPMPIQSISIGDVSGGTTEVPPVIVDAVSAPAILGLLEPVFVVGETLTASIQDTVSIAADAVAELSAALPEIVQGGNLLPVTGSVGSLLAGADGLLDSTLESVNSLTLSTLTTLNGTVDQLLSTTEPLLASLGLPRLDLVGDLLDGTTTLVGSLVEEATSLTGNLTGTILAVAGEALVSLPDEVGTGFSTEGESLAAEGTPSLEAESPVAEWIVSLLPVMEVDRGADDATVSPEVARSEETADSREALAIAIGQRIVWIEGAVASVVDGLSTTAATDTVEESPEQSLPNRSVGSEESFGVSDEATGAAPLVAVDGETMLDLAMGAAARELEVALTTEIAASSTSATADSLLLTAEIAPAVFLLLLSRPLPEQEDKDSRRRRRTNGAMANGVVRRGQLSSIGRRGAGVMAVDSTIGLRDHALASLVETVLPAVVSLPTEVAQEASAKQEPGSLAPTEGLPLLALVSGVAKVAWNRAKQSLRRTGIGASRTAGR